MLQYDAVSMPFSYQGQQPEPAGPEALPKAVLVLVYW